MKATPQPTADGFRKIRLDDLTLSRRELADEMGLRSGEPLICRYETGSINIPMPRWRHLLALKELSELRRRVANLELIAGSKRRTT